MNRNRSIPDVTRVTENSKRLETNVSTAKSDDEDIFHSLKSGLITKASTSIANRDCLGEGEHAHVQHVSGNNRRASLIYIIVEIIIMVNLVLTMWI